MAAYVVGAAALSVIPSLYWPEYAPVPRAASITRCADELDRLQRDLVRKAGKHLQNPAGQQGLSTWLGRWDARLLSLSGDCGPLEPARDELQRLRADVERLLRRYDRDQAPTLHRIQRLLSSYQETTSS